MPVSGLYLSLETSFRIGPDISIRRGHNVSQHHLVYLDVSITSPLANNACVITPINGQSANRVVLAKMRKYEEISSANNASFIPLVFETTGFINEEAVKFFRNLAKEAESYRKIKQDILFRFFMKRISFALTSGVAHCLRSRLGTSLGHNASISMDSCFSRDNILADAIGDDYTC